LIKTLEESGVGRPSTYNTMANVVVDRGYTYLEGRSYRMNPLGDEVAVNLEKNFPDIMNIEFTKNLEEHLDKIADGDEA
jgi:DNA topoisomerase-1